MATTIFIAKIGSGLRMHLPWNRTDAREWQRSRTVALMAFESLGQISSG